MRVLIVEDENIAAEKLEMMLREIDPGIQVLAKTGSVKKRQSGSTCTVPT
jgi:hypothetical protein